MICAGIAISIRREISHLQRLTIRRGEIINPQSFQEIVEAKFSFQKLDPFFFKDYRVKITRNSFWGELFLGSIRTWYLILVSSLKRFKCYQFSQQSFLELQIMVAKICEQLILEPNIKYEIFFVWLWCFNMVKAMQLTRRKKYSRIASMAVETQQWYIASSIHIIEHTKICNQLCTRNPRAREIQQI